VALKIEKVDDAWLGPGAKDGVIVPVKPEENGWQNPGSKFYGEWWYFDARLADGHVVVGFIQASELLTRKPGVELHIYKPSGEKLSSVQKYTASAFRAARDGCDARVGDCWCKGEYPSDGGLPTHRLYIKQDGMEADLTFTSEVPGWKPGQGKSDFGDRGYMSWVVAVPRARVSGTVSFEGRTLEASGIGYHDHNVVTADMRRIISFWYWGRLYTDDYTLLYAYVKTQKRFGGHASKPLMLARGGEVVLSNGEMNLREGMRLWNDTAHRDYPSSLLLTVPGELSLELKVKEVIDAHDLLDDLPQWLMNKVVRAAVNKFIGRPGWFRFNSDFVLRVREEELRGTTLHEMVALQ
jgi:predicted secreted hydrolase